MRFLSCLALGALAFLLPGCTQPGAGGSPFETNPPIPLKRLITNSAPVELILYVDTEKYSPLNAMDYCFSASAESSETQLFNHVVLAYAYLTKDGQGYTRIELSPALRYVLENSRVFIKPLHRKGIKVLVELRSGIFSDSDEGLGAGFGTMDMAAIDVFTAELGALADKYGIDGFDFNDTGGGRNSCPPLSRNLTRFRSDRPLYPGTLFKDPEGNELGEAETESLLWREGGNNFCNFIYRANEILKDNWITDFINGAQSYSETRVLQKVIFVHATNHGNHLLSFIRNDYMPDAYSGADPKVTGNLRYVVNTTPYDNTRPHAYFLDEEQNLDVGAEADDQYVPFAIDLSDPKDADTARLWARTFLLKDPNGSQTLAANQNRYGALLFTNLRPVSEGGGNNAAHLTYFTQILFGRTTRLAGSPGAGDYKKNW